MMKFNLLQAELDEINWQLLWELQENARQSFTQLAGKVGLTSQAVRQRIDLLEKHRIIVGYHAAVNTEMMGLSLTAFIRVTLRREGHPQSQFAIVVKGFPEVLECHKVTGEESFILKTVVMSRSHLDYLVEALESYGNCVTSVVLSSPIPRRSISRDILRG
ncbi:Lrp/AsnC family transcriptional regulator [Dictyobacter formicarum]|uniref:AsnC family transcriptional regulator n=1 Tax=Dictyobacter formicarum TaxID=2778368 RepID=A0ABQ3VPV3_9CHLR|nr:Lrp/AsnC family transcriptional regulator [Dictyobacter formicarum]GHO88287.1 AsnC family transcriptional regulator [Dictyobacter formicarum]